MPVILRNNSLKVTIDKPGEVYDSSRFDWSGQVSQVVLNNRHTFCTTEIADGSQRSNKGTGICNEFGIVTPVGYDECPPGSLFPKIGVGLLKKETEEPFNFFKPYQVIPASFETKQSSDSKLSITSGIGICNGYSWFLEKTFEIDRTTLHIRYSLINNGSKPLITEEYCHNFIAIDGLQIDHNYRLKFPVPTDINILKEFVNPNHCIVLENNEISWNRAPESDFFLSDLNAGHGKINTWSLINTEAGTGLSETCNFTPAQCNVWGKGHVISPEIFVQVSLQPGETKEWERKYEFFAL
jgi:hypothetical protein